MEESGLHITRQRRAILDAIRSVQSHPSADQVYEMVRKKMPHISLGTVYRNLEILSRKGLIQRLDGEMQKHYDGNVCSHPHLRCVKCGWVYDLPVELEDQVAKVREQAKDFEIHGQRVEFLGVCSTCKAGKDEDQ